MGGKTGPEKRQKNLDRPWFREFGVYAGIVAFLGGFCSNCDVRGTDADVGDHNLEKFISVNFSEGRA